MKKIWYDRAWSEYADWQTRDKKTIKPAITSDPYCCHKTASTMI